MMNFSNPVLVGKGNTSDPYVVLDGDTYYHCYQAADAVKIAAFHSLDQIGSDSRTIHTVFQSQEYTDFYAPELHKIDGWWYIYAAPCRVGDNNHFMVVLRAKTQDPCGSYECLGPIEGIGEKWSIDATVFTYHGKRYMIYTDCRTMFMAEMENPAKLKGTPMALTTVQYPWEQKMGPVVEGPAVIFDGDCPCVIYSASDSRGDDYCLGQLRLVGQNIMEPHCWEKHPEPILTKQPGMYGPGHCSFTFAGEDMYCVYHANLQSGTGWNGRSVFIKKAWFQDGILVFS